MEDKSFISLAEATRYCTYSQDYLNLLIRRGRLKGVKMGRNWVTTQEWLRAYLASERKVGRPSKLRKSEAQKLIPTGPTSVSVPQDAITSVRSLISLVPSLIHATPATPSLHSVLSLGRSLVAFALVGVIVFIAASPAVQGALGALLKDTLSKALNPFSFLASFGGSEGERSVSVLPLESPATHSDRASGVPEASQKITPQFSAPPFSPLGGETDVAAQKETRAVTEIIERKESVIPADLSSFREALHLTDQELKLTQRNFELTKGGLESDIEALKNELAILKLQALSTPVATSSSIGPAIREVIRETVIRVATPPGAAFGSKEITQSMESGAIAPTTLTVGNTTLGGNVITNLTTISGSPTITGTLTISGAGTSTIATSTQNLILSGAANTTVSPSSFYPILLNPYGGNVGIGTTSPWRALGITGTVGLSSSLSAESGSDNYLCMDPASYEVTDGGANCGASSIRYKKDIATLNYGLEAILQLNPVSFYWNAAAGRPQDQERHLGFIAEEVYGIIPEVVTLNTSSTPESIEYDKLTAILTKAVQELNAKVEDLKQSRHQGGSSIQTFIDALKQLGIYIEQGIVRTGEFIAKKMTAEFVYTNQLCLGATCIDEAQLKIIISSTGAAAVSPTPSLNPNPMPASTEAPSPAPSENPAPSSMPTPTGTDI